MGIETHVFAWENGAVARDQCDFFYPISIREKEAILEKARVIKPDGVTSIASDLAVPTVSYVAQELGLIGNPFKFAAQTTNKYLMRRLLCASGLPCPRFWLVDSREAETDCLADLRFPLIVKPTDRSGSRGVKKIENELQLQLAINRSRNESFEKRALIEEFIVGREVSVEMISWQGQHHFLAITDKVTTGEPFFVETEHHQPARISKSVSDKIIETVRQALTCLGIENGASHTEILITPEGRPFIVEIGARMGGDCIGSHLVELSTGYDYLRGVIEVALGCFSPVVKTCAQCAGIYFTTAPKGFVTKIIDRSNEFPCIVDSQMFIEEGAPVSELTESGFRLGYFIYTSQERFIPATPPLAAFTSDVLPAKRDDLLSMTDPLEPVLLEAISH